MIIEKLKHFSKFEDKQKIIFIFLIILILAAGVFVRFWQLGTIPPGIHYDEAYNGINAIQALESGNYKWFYADNTGREGFHINAIAFFINLFGVNNFALRFANALWGSLTLLGFYFLLRELRFSKLSILLGVFMLSFSFWHLDFSRTAYRAIMVPLVIIWSAFLLFKGINVEKRKILFFVSAGAIMGLGFHTYIAFRVAPLIFAILGLVFLIFHKDFFKKNWKSIALFCVVALIIASPIIYYFCNNFNELTGRSQSVSIFKAANLTPFQAFSKSLGYHLRAFFVHGDGNPRHNYNSQPLVPWSWIIFLVSGFLISLREIIITILNRSRTKKKDPGKIVSDYFYVSVLAQSIFWVMLVPGVMSIEGVPHSLRIIGVIPGVFLFSILPFEYLVKFYRKIKNLSDPKNPRIAKLIPTAIAASALLVLFGGYVQARTYFVIWANDLRTEVGFERKLYLLGITIRDLAVHKNNYVIVANNTSVSADHKTSSFKTTEFIAYPNIKKYEFYKPLEGIDRVDCDDIRIVFLDSDQWLRDRYRDHCSGNLATEIKRYDDNKYSFYVMETKK